MTALASPGQVRAIQIARRPAGLADEGAYRAALQGFGVSSSKALTADQAGAFLDRLNGGRGGLDRPASRTVTGEYRGILQVLWLALYNLGVVRERDDAALLAMVERQTGIPHTRFLRDPADAAKAIEALKAMAARAGVEWPAKPGPGAINRKRAIVAAQFRRLADAGRPQLITFDRLGPAELDDLSRRLGRELRRAAG